MAPTPRIRPDTAHLMGMVGERAVDRRPNGSLAF
jgi:hypothetical protein